MVETLGKVRVDLLERRLRLTPNSALIPELRYRVHLRGSLHALDGRRTAERAQIFDFIAGDSLRSPTPARPTISDEEVLQLFAPRCASCHRSATSAAGVDLSSAPRMRATLLGQPSPIEGVPLVRTGDHARSYLMRKLLGQAGFIGEPMPPTAALLSPNELRLVADWIDGLAR